jgi:hypothetical protein
MLLSLKEHVKMIDQETNACQEDAVELAAYKKYISAFDEGTTSRERSTRIINKGDNTSSQTINNDASRERSPRIINKGDNATSQAVNDDTLSHQHSFKNRAIPNDTKKDDFRKEEMNQGDVIPKQYYMNNSVISSDKKNNSLQEEGKSQDDLSNASMSDDKSENNEAYSSDDFGINDYANDEIEDEEDEGGLLHVPKILLNCFQVRCNKERQRLC